MSASSMSVHSLIDKFQGEQAALEHSGGNRAVGQLPKLVEGRRTAAEPLSKDRLLESDKSLDNKPDIKTPTLPPLQQTSLPPSFNQGHSTHPSFSSYKTSPSHQQPSGGVPSSLHSILGDDYKDNISEEALVELIRLKTEQEKTRQQQIKLDIVTRNYSLLTAALNANIPSYLIPQVCVNPNEPERRSSTSLAHSRDNSQDFGSLPVNYRFGSGGSNSSTPMMSSHTGPSNNIGNTQGRPLSPAKLGAQAVANLASPTSSYRFPASKPPLIPQHQRHFSMPIDSKVKAANIDLSKVEAAQHQHQQQQKLYPYLQPHVLGQSQLSHTRSYSMSKSSGLGLSFLGIPRLPGRNNSPVHSRSKSITSVSSKGSLLGSSSTMQVKPAPAQPLQKQGKLPPSQESMTSFQHVIQFQHWKPEDPSKEYVERSHKRHKSHADNMSIDM